MNGSRLEALLANLLRYGSWVASIAIGVGLALALIDSRFANMRIATVGIILFILLPTARVLLMLIVFAYERDYRLAIAAALVLAIIFLGFVVGIRSALNVAVNSGSANVIAGPVPPTVPARR